MSMYLNRDGSNELLYLGFNQDHGECIPSNAGRRRHHSAPEFSPVDTNMHVLP